MTPIIFGIQFYFATKPASLLRRLPQERRRLWQQSGPAGAGPLCCGSNKGSSAGRGVVRSSRNWPLEGRLRPPKRPIARMRKESLDGFFRIRAVEIV
jgi:hypothetical protein